MSSIAPVLNGIFWAEQTQINYLGRDVSTLLWATPDDRLIDYFGRHTFNVPISCYTMYLAYRFVEQYFNVPNLVHLLDLSKLKQQYTDVNSIHRPDFLNQVSPEILPKVVKDWEKDLPPALRKQMLSEMVSPRSFNKIADLLNGLVAQETLKSKEKGRPLSAETHETRLLAHHMRRLLNPEEYVQKHLSTRFSAEEVGLLNERLRLMDEWKALFEETKKAVAIPLGKNNRKNWLRILFGRPPVISEEDSQKGEAAVEKLITRLKDLGTPSEKGERLIQKLLARHDNKTLVEALRGRSFRAFLRDLRSLGKAAAQEQFSEFNRLSATDHFLEALYQDVLEPLAKKVHPDNPRLTEVLTDLSKSKVTILRIDKMIAGGRLWLKIPISVVLGMLTYGVLISGFDVKYMQPYQREVVRLRGDTKEFLKPAFLGAIPGALVYAALYFTPFIQKRLGHFWSFAVAGLAGQATWALSTYYLFSQILKSPRKNAPKPKRATPPNPRQPVPFPNGPMVKGSPFVPMRSQVNAGIPGKTFPQQESLASNAFTMTRPRSSFQSLSTPSWTTQLNPSPRSRPSNISRRPVGASPQHS